MILSPILYNDVEVEVTLLLNVTFDVDNVVPVSFADIVLSVVDVTFSASVDDAL